MISGLSNNSGQMSRIFSRLDANGDSKVSKDEFLAGKPDDVSEDKAASLFDQLDSQKTGALSQDDLATGFQKMASQMQATLIQSQGGQHGPGSEPPDHEEMFDKMDTNQDGKVSADEFIASRPKNVSEEEAKSFYDKLSGDNKDGLSKEQFVAGMEANRPPRPPEMSQNNSADSSESSELISQFMQAINAYKNSALTGYTVNGTSLAA